MGTVPEAMEIKRPVKDKKLAPALTIGVPTRVVPAQPSLVRPSHILRSRTGTRVTISCSTSADGSARFIQISLRPRIRPGPCRGGCLYRVSVARRRLGQYRPGSCEEPRRRSSRLTPAPCRISILRVFFRDLQEWELIPRRFDPMRSMVTPKSLLALLARTREPSQTMSGPSSSGPANLTVDDLPKKGDRSPCPISINRLSD